MHDVARYDDVTRYFASGRAGGYQEARERVLRWLDTLRSPSYVDYASFGEYANAVNAYERQRQGGLRAAERLYWMRRACIVINGEENA